MTIRAKTKKYNNLFMEMTKLSAKMSFCKRLQVGCIITKDNRPISNGWNGTLPYMDNCCEDEIDGELKTKDTVQHAERNAMDVCAKNGISLKGCTMYITHAPCVECAKSIYSTGITTVIYESEYKSTDGIELLQSVGVDIQKYEN